MRDTNTGNGVREVGTRIEDLLAQITDSPNAATAEELVQLLVDLYGRGLQHITTLLTENDTTALDRLVDDELISSLLLIHGLHPIDVDTRIQTALDTVRPYLGSHAGGVEYLGVDNHGIAHLKLAGSCNGCASSAITVTLAIETAILDAAPDITSVHVEGVRTPEPTTPLLQIGPRPPQLEPGWTPLPELGPPTSRPTTLELHGTRILICSLRGTLYAYRDTCATCTQSLTNAHLTGPILTCPHCHTTYDIHHAGTNPNNPTTHLDPLPLLTDSHGTRIALPTTVAP